MRQEIHQMARRRPAVRRCCFAVALAVVMAGGCSQPRIKPAPPAAAEEPHTAILLTDVSDRCGVDFVHTDGSSGERYIVEPMSAGLALFDFDGDGWIDIYLLNGAPLPGCRVVSPPRNALYRNLGGWQFVDVTEAAGVGDTGYGLGVTVGDFDNDGSPDLYLNNYGPNVLYRNNGDGTFTNVTEPAARSARCILLLEASADRSFALGAEKCYPRQN